MDNKWIVNAHRIELDRGVENVDHRTDENTETESWIFL